MDACSVTIRSRKAFCATRPCASVASTSKLISSASRALPEIRKAPELSEFQEAPLKQMKSTYLLKLQMHMVGWRKKPSYYELSRSKHPRPLRQNKRMKVVAAQFQLMVGLLTPKQRSFFSVLWDSSSHDGRDSSPRLPEFLTGNL